MIAIWVITPILLGLSAFFNALMDLSSEGYFKGWWDKNTGAENKWKLGRKENGEAFPLSSTVLVFLTDGWHLFQFLFHSCWQMAIAIHFPYWFGAFWIIKIIFSGIFEQIYSRIKKHKKHKT